MHRTILKRLMIVLFAAAVISPVSFMHDSSSSDLIQPVLAEVPRPAFRAIYEGDRSAKLVTSGEHFEVKFVFRNIGATHDFSESGIILVAMNEETRFFATDDWEEEMIVSDKLLGRIASNEGFVFTAQMRAPRAPGSYQLSFKLFEEAYAYVPYSDVELPIEVQPPLDPKMNPYAYEARVHGGSDLEMRLRPGEEKEIQFKLLNTGDAPWLGYGEKQLSLKTARPYLRPSLFFDETDWIDVVTPATLIEPHVNPGRVGTFAFTLRAPKEEGIYEESFALWNEEIGAVGDFRLDLALDVKRYKDRFDKYIRIDLSNQKLFLHEDGEIVASYVISSGAAATPTPEGVFKVLSKDEDYWSRMFKMTLPYWMHFSGLGHGLHELPIFANGQREGEDHLGMAVSHGCVRLGLGEAKEVFDWAEIGDPIVVEK